MSKLSYHARKAYEKYHGPIPEGMWVDHIDGDRTNNSPENLRLATPSQNQGNLGKRKNNSSGYRGVSYHAITGKWKAQLVRKGTTRYLGIYDTPEQAYAVYCIAAKEYFGEHFQDRGIGDRY